MAINIEGEKKSIRVLVVDEGSEFFEQVQDQADQNSHHYKMACKLVTQISEVAEMIRSWNPSVVMLDVANSPINSAEIAKGCSQLEVPLIVTGYTHNKEIQASIEKIGAIAYVVKSEDPEDIDQVLELLATVAKEELLVH